MIFDKARMAKLSGLMVESSHKGIKDAKADQFGGGKEEGDPWLDGEVTTEGDMGPEEGDMMPEVDDKMEADEPPTKEARRKKGHDSEEDAVREMIRNEMRNAKKDLEKEQAEEKDVREAVRKEIRSVLRSRGVTMGGTGWGFKR
jgi:hypothetical protein